MATVVDITTENYENEVLNSDIPVLIDFYADWCGPCEEMSPHFEEAAGKFSGRVKFGRVDTAAEKQLRIKFCIASLPTITFVRDGKRIDILDELASAEEIERRVEIALRGELDDTLARPIR